ncbi:MAG TPA: hypothetical protein VMD53_12310 [Rhizomicrobium sp.]|nr:hypothetical protein [Rhizomicrobium sp.]
MTHNAVPDDLEIAPGHTVGKWKSLSLADLDAHESPDGKSAFTILGDRIRLRFFDPVDALIRAECGRNPKRFGFAILAIDCLVIETLQAFRCGVCNHHGKSGELFERFLTQWDAFTTCLPNGTDAAGAKQFAQRFYTGYRCGLHHAGGTDQALRVRADGPAFEFTNQNEMRVNRTLLHQALVREFDGYLSSLREPSGCALRKNFRSKMDYIAGHTRP